MKGLRTVLKEWLPPFAARWLRRHRWQRGQWPRSEWSGDYNDWDEALKASQGYASSVILERVTQATREVLAGRAAYERDAVAFPEPAVDPNVLACFEEVIADRNGELRVTDFGGSLGSLFFQYRPHLMSARKVNWTVVEQTHFVERGREIMRTPELSFAGSLDELTGGASGGLLLLGSVLSYLRDPWQIVQRGINDGYRFILIDRTACLRRRPTRLTVQQVPEEVYPASYPAWLFNEQELLAPFERNYRLLKRSVSPFSSLRIQEDGAEVEWKTFFFRRKH